MMQSLEFIAHSSHSSNNNNMSTINNLNDGDHGGSGGSPLPLARLANLSPAHPAYAATLLPGPFVVLQGSPGDGMANTIDSVPALPPPTTPAAGGAGNSGGGPASRRASIENRIPDRVLEELDSEVSAESDDGADADHLGQPPGEGDVPPNVSRGGQGQGVGGRDRGNSVTEGGLHLPLGASSPIMQKALGTFLAGGGGYGSPRRRVTAEEEAAAASSFGLPLEDDNDTDSSPSNSSPSTSPSNSAFLKRRPTRQPKSSAGDSSPPKRRNITTDGDQNDGTASAELDNNALTNKTPEEAQATNQWRKECLQQELSHLDESNMNVKVLMQRRIRSREQRLQQSARSVSPSPTATSASSGSSSDSMSTSSREGGSNADSNNDASKGKEPADPLNDVLQALELTNVHRTWYQRDGRLVVLESLPHMSLQGVVANPVAPGKSSSRSINKEVATLSPGCTVMAESAYVLDSRTLRQIHPKPPNAGDNSTHDDVSESDPQLTFLKITSPHEGYVLSSIHSYPLILPGLPTTYTDANQWLWRVTCRPDGAFVRVGLELVAEHLGTLPYGTVCGVTKKVVNGMGLNRLQIEAYLDKGAGGTKRRDTDSDDDAEADALGMAQYSGYISEFLNPLSGQRGNVVEPIPFPAPALYEVVHPKGCVIRSGVELSTAQIGFAPPGSMLSIVGRSYSDHPGHNCIERLRLAGGGGWISVSLNKRPPANETLVKMVGVDGSFNPDDPSAFHFESMRKVMSELHANSDVGGASGAANASRRVSEGGSDARVTFRRLSSYANLSEIGDDDAAEQQPTSSDEDHEARHGVSGAMGISPRVPTLFRSAAPGLPAMDAIRESSSDSHHHPSSGANRCLICLSDERTATIVHGETGHIACCLTCARILKARGDNCPVCRLPIDLVIQQFWA